MTSRRLFKKSLWVLIWFSKIIQAKILCQRLKNLNLVPTVLNVWHPFDLMFAGRLGERVSFWYVYDEVSRFPGNLIISEVIERIESENINRVDLVFGSSRSQFQRRRDSHPRVFMVPNGADFALMNRALTEDLPEPIDLRNVPRPRIGYVGRVDHRLDYGLLQELARSHPEWSLVLVGWARDTGKKEASALQTLPNVHILGDKPHEEIPSYLKGFDVGLIPFLVTPSTSTMYPLKLHEYLAGGLPVVSTNLDELRPFSEVVSIASNSAEFVSRIEEALATNSPEKVTARVAVARENSWERRVAEMNILIDQFL